MKCKTLPVFFLLAAASLASAQPAAQTPSMSIAEGNTAFALSMYGELAREKGNVLFSPYSVSTAMAMVYSGARGNTAAEMKQALHFQIDQQQLPAAIKALTGELTAAAAKSNQKLSIANALCSTGGIFADVSKDYKTLIKEQYDGEIFSGGLDEINGWVNKKTEGKIPKILDHLTANSVCVLLNAIYFKGTWENPFDKNYTADGAFSVSAAQQVTVPFMRQANDFQMLDKQDFQAVSIPYSGKHLSMVILLPKDSDGLAGLEKQLSGDKLQQWLGELDKAPAQKIALSMPKFTLNTGYDLIPACKDLGIKDAFATPPADFSGMDGKKDLYISQIKHKAFMEVNEEGAEAAAATAVEMAGRGAPEEIPIFRADHPFLLMIRDNEAGTILFLGRIADPSKGV